MISSRSFIDLKEYPPHLFVKYHCTGQQVELLLGAVTSFAKWLDMLVCITTSQSIGKSETMVGTAHARPIGELVNCHHYFATLSKRTLTSNLH